MNEAIVIEPVTARSLPEIHDDLVELLQDALNGGAALYARSADGTLHPTVLFYKEL